MVAAALLPVFGVGLLGSVHCAGMCGGIVGALSVALSLALIVGHAMDVRRLEEQAIVARATQHIAALSERLTDGALTIDGFERAVEGRGLAYASLRDDAGVVLAGAHTVEA